MWYLKNSEYIYESTYFDPFLVCFGQRFFANFFEEFFVNLLEDVSSC